MFITFEGLDCSGKSTQAKLLADRLRQLGRDVLLLREPGGTVISEKVRTILLDRSHDDLDLKTELLLFSAARAQLVCRVILPALHAGTIVVCDRFYDSTTAYQGYGRGLDLDDVRTINRIATGGTTPQLTMLVDIDVAEISRRQQSAKLPADRMEVSGDQFFEHVRSGYHLIARAEPQRFVVIDGHRPVMDIHDDVWRIVHERFL